MKGGIGHGEKSEGGQHGYLTVVREVGEQEHRGQIVEGRGAQNSGFGIYSKCSEKPLEDF